MSGVTGFLVSPAGGFQGAQPRLKMKNATGDIPDIPKQFSDEHAHRFCSPPFSRSPMLEATAASPPQETISFMYPWIGRNTYLLCRDPVALSS